MLIERQPGFAVGATTANTIVTFGSFLTVVVIGSIATYPNLPAVPLMATSLAIALVVPVLFYRGSYTTWGAIDLAMHPLEPHEVADADAALAMGEEKPAEGP